MFKPTERGFTLVELIVTLIVVGILALTVMPRFIGRQVFDTRGAYEAVAGSLRFARQQAVAQRRQVCVDVAASGSLAITQASAPSPGVCDGEGSARCQRVARRQQGPVRGSRVVAMRVLPPRQDLLGGIRLGAALVGSEVA